MAEREISAQLSELQRETLTRYPKPLLRVTRDMALPVRGKSLQEIAHDALRWQNTELQVEGQVHAGRTVLIANHPAWNLDPFCLIESLGDNADSLKVLAREETLAALPKELRPYVIPVDTAVQDERSGLQGHEVYAAKVIHKLLPPATDGRRRRTLTALHIAAQHVLNGGTVAIFEERSLGSLMGSTQSWQSGVGKILDEVVRNNRTGEDTFVQFLALEPDGNVENPFRKTTVKMRAASPISLTELVSDMSVVNRKTLTQKVQGEYMDAFK